MATPTEPISRQTIRKLEEKGRTAVQKNFATLTEFSIEYVDVDSIFPNSYNPNRQTERDFELLKKSITEDGFTQPIIVQSKTRQIVDGEHRWRAMHQLGFKQIPVVFVDMTYEQMRIATLRHNRARGSEDIELTIKMLQDLRALGSLEEATASLMMSDRELNALINDLPAPEALATPDHSEAWIPSEAVLIDKEAQLRNRKRLSSSDHAEERIQEMEEEIDELPTHIEQTEYSKESMKEILRLTLLFEQDKAEIVKAVLEPHPAQFLLELAYFHYLTYPNEYADDLVAPPSLTSIPLPA